jgi:hypothetical protein
VAQAAIVALLPAVALAQPSETRRPVRDAFRLQVQGPCLEQVSLSDRIERWIGGAGVTRDLQIDLAGREIPRVALVLTLSRAGTAPALRRLDFAPGSCAGLREAVSLVIAMAIDATAVSRALDEAASTGPRAPEFRRSVAVSASPFVPLGLLGNGLPLAAEVAVESWFAQRMAVDLGISYLPSAAVRIGDGGARLTLLLARLGGCAVTMRAGRRLRLGACGGIIGGRVAARGIDFPAPRDGAGLWLAVMAGAELRFVVREPFELFARADAVAALVRPSLEVRQAQGAVVASQRLGVVGGLVQAGLSVRLF